MDSEKSELTHRPVRSRRSVLYVPASKPRAMEKARDLNCDTVIFDLEDAVGGIGKARRPQRTGALVLPATARQ